MFVRRSLPFPSPSHSPSPFSLPISAPFPLPSRHVRRVRSWVWVSVFFFSLLFLSLSSLSLLVYVLLIALTLDAFFLLWDANVAVEKRSESGKFESGNLMAGEERGGRTIGITRWAAVQSVRRNSSLLIRNYSHSFSLFSLIFSHSIPSSFQFVSLSLH